MGGHTLVVAEKLVCPDRVGRLTRTAMAPDGQSCGYSAENGSEITLGKMGGRPSDELLRDVQSTLSAIVPPPAFNGTAKSDKPAQAEWGDDDKSDDAGKYDDSKDDDDKSQSSGRHHNHNNEHVSVDLPSIHIKSDGDVAKVNLPGININANEGSAHIATNIGPIKNMTIDANDKDAVIQSNLTDAANTNRTWFSVSDHGGQNGYHAVGYVARGPNSGPLVIAQLKSKGEHDHDPGREFFLDDVRHLVDLSVK